MGRQTMPEWCMCVIHLLPCPVGFPFLRTAALGVVKGPGQEATGTLSQVYYSYYLHYDLLRQLSPFSTVSPVRLAECMPRNRRQVQAS